MFVPMLAVQGTAGLVYKYGFIPKADGQKLDAMLATAKKILDQVLFC